MFPPSLKSCLPRQTELPRLLSRPLDFARGYAISLTVLCVGSLADLLTTWHNLRLYGPGVETHPVQRLVSQVAGVNAGVPIAKAFQFAFVLLVAAWWKPWTRPILLICGVLYLAASISNYFLLL